MPRYFFDVRDGEQVVSSDLEGVDVSLEKAWLEAAQSVAELAKDRMPKRLGRREQTMVIDVCDQHGPVLAVSVTFKSELLPR
jgi:hypothetical protein